MDARPDVDGWDIGFVEFSGETANVKLFFATEIGKDAGGIGPDAHGAVRRGGEETATVVSESDGGDGRGVDGTRVRGFGGFVVVETDPTVGGGDGEGGAVWAGDVEGDELRIVNVVDDAYNGGVGGVPPGDLAVRSGCDNLSLTGVDAEGFEVGGAEE